MSSLPKCYFDKKNLIAKVGSVYKGYKELKCVQVPTFKKIESERESLGNGWYGGKIKVEKTYDCYYVILENNKPFGVLYRPYDLDMHNIKSEIYPINTKHPFKEISDFILKLQEL